MVNGQILDPHKIHLPYPENESNVQQRRLGEILCGIPDECVPRGMTMRAYCDRNNVSYLVMENIVCT